MYRQFIPSNNFNRILSFSSILFPLKNTSHSIENYRIQSSIQNYFNKNISFSSNSISLQLFRPIHIYSKLFRFKLILSDLKSIDLDQDYFIQSRVILPISNCCFNNENNLVLLIKYTVHLQKSLLQIIRKIIHMFV